MRNSLILLSSSRILDHTWSHLANAEVATFLIHHSLQTKTSGSREGVNQQYRYKQREDES